MFTARYISGKASATILNNRFVKVTGNGTIGQANGTAGEAIIGSSSEVTYNAGEYADYTREGIPSIIIGGTVTAGAFLKSDANGKAVTASAGDFVGGIAKTDGILNDQIDIIPFYGKI
jgi:hypothetical protein